MNLMVKLAMSNKQSLWTPTQMEPAAGFIPLDGRAQEVSKEPVMLAIQPHEAFLACLMDYSGNCQRSRATHKAWVAEARSSWHW
jgi:hypothetical protein